MSLFDDVGEKVFTRRAVFIGGLQCLGLGILGARLAWLQVSQGARYKMLSDRNRINIKMLPPPRGHVVDRFGVPLAVNTENYRLLIVPEQVDDLEKTLRYVKDLIDIREADIKRVMKEAKRTAKFIPLRVKDGLSWQDVARLEVNLYDLPGLSVDRGEVRSYPYRDATAHIVGYVRSVSQKDLDKDKDPVLRSAGFKIGKAGIERYHDSSLRGETGASEVEVNVVGREVRELKRRNAVQGKRVTLAIDGELQRYTQEILSEHKSASAVVMDAHTGAVYAMASHPSFDPDAFVRGLSHDEWQIIRDDPAKPQTNKTIEGQYPPGSTFKMITVLAALEAGIVDKHTSFHCPGHFQLGNGKFHCWKKTGHGRVNVFSALAESCDIYFYEIAAELGIERIAEMSRRFGLDALTGIDLRGERSGLIPDNDWKRGRFDDKWHAGESVVASIGQGYILTTPLQLAVMTARLVNGAKAVEPWLTGYVGDEFKGKSDFAAIDINPDYLDIVKKGMNMVVNGERGTARRSAIKTQGFEMGGKTGTAQVQRITKEQRRLKVKNEDLPWAQRHHALFVGYAPVHDPKYVCSVVVEHGVSGSGAAAPIAQALMERVQRRDPAKTVLQPETADAPSHEEG